MNQAITELNIDARGAAAGAAQYERAMESAAQARDRMLARDPAFHDGMDRTMRLLGSGVPQSANRTVEAFRRIEASIDPVLRATHRAEQEMTKSLAIIDRAVQLGVRTQLEADTVIGNLRERQIRDINRVRDAQIAASAADARAAMGVVPMNDNVRNNRFVAQNVGYQLQDVAVTAAMGMPIGTIALQQGMQIGAAFGDMGATGAVNALKGAVLGLASPINLVAIGLTGAAAAAIQYATSSTTTSEKIEEALQRQDELLKGIEKRYGMIADASQRAFSSSRLGDVFGIADSVRELEFLLREQGGALRAPSGISNAWEQFRGRAGQFDVQWAARAGQGWNATALPIGVAEGQFKPFEDAIMRLFATARDGIPDFVEFRRLILERWALEPNNEALSKTVRIMMDATAEGTRLTDAWKEMEAAQRRLLAGQRGFIVGSPEDDARNDYFDAQRAAMREAATAFDVDRMAMRARSPAELANVARARAAASYPDDESNVVRLQRIDLAGRRALAEAEHQLAEARLARAAALGDTITAATLDGLFETMENVT